MQPNPSQPAVGKKSSGSDSPRSFYAHSNGVLPEKWHLLEDHLQSVAKLSAEFAQSFDSSDWAWNAGWLHDLGKAADEFQAYLMRENGLDDEGYDLSGRGRVNHSSAGAAFAEERFNLAQCPIGRVLAYIIAGHHAGLPDWFSSDTAGAAWSARLEEGQTNLNRIRPIIGDFVADLKAVEKPPSFVNQDNFHLWVRMLFSCLVDSDFLDTEAFMNPDQARLRGGFVPMADLKSVFDKSMADLSGRTSAEIGSVNLIRQEILERCRFAAKDAPGLFSLTVPTGGGKTLSSMAFALEHALRHKKSRIIYVIPYTSIIEQTAGVFASIFGRDNVVEHHSNLDPERETQRTRFASENWDAPIIVTTNVQFFESLFAARPSRCRKIHNIINSVVVLDEAQLLPPGKLTPCVDVINQLSRHYGVSFIFSTATQPALPNLDGVREIIPNVSELYSRLKRTEILMPEALQTPVSWEDLAKELQAHEQVLCVVNTRRDCYDLFRLMPEGTIHLSALMCGEHRSRIIQEIKRRLENKETVRVISTQLVEAGVDIDFPAAYRALAGLDSIAQAAGRCNREGRLSRGEVHVFVPPLPAPRGLLLKGENATRELCGLPDFDTHKPETFTRYFHQFYFRVNDTGGQFKEWLTVDDQKVLAVQFRTVALNFNFIDDHAQQAVFVRFGESQRSLNELKVIGPTRQNMRRLQRYTVNLSKHAFAEAKAGGLVEEISKGFWLWNGRYDGVCGLDLFGGGFSAEDLIV